VIDFMRLRDLTVGENPALRAPVLQVSVTSVDVKSYVGNP